MTARPPYFTGGQPVRTSSGGVNIDMREEFSAIVDGDGSTPPQGHWVIYRRHDTTKRSEYWDEEWGESIGGPSWEYSEEVIRCRFSPVTSGSLTRFFEMELEPGIIHVGYRIYYVAHTVSPKIEDQVFEIQWDDHSLKPSLGEVPIQAISRWNINEVAPYRGDYGRIEFYACLCRRENVRS